MFLKTYNILAILTISVIFDNVTCFSLYKKYDKDKKQLESIDAEELGDYFEGDMILDENQKDAIESNQRNGLIEELYRWPGSLILYKFSDDFIDRCEYRNAIRDALDILENATCLKFLPKAESTADYILITGNDTGCFSEVGRVGGVQRLNLYLDKLGSGCFRPGTIQHEFIHAIGFFHQQSATNRDDYVQIVEENIEPKHLHNFQKYSATYITDFGIDYDYDSVMHYGPKAFSKNGNDTIIPLIAGVKIGQRIGISEKDIKKINVMYKCDQIYNIYKMR